MNTKSLRNGGLFLSSSKSFKMEQSKIIGMVHIPEVNDEAYAKWLASQPPVVLSNLWFQLP